MLLLCKKKHFWNGVPWFFRLPHVLAGPRRSIVLGGWKRPNGFAADELHPRFWRMHQAPGRRGGLEIKETPHASTRCRLLVHQIPPLECKKRCKTHFDSSWEILIIKSLWSTNLDLACGLLFWRRFIHGSSRCVHGLPIPWGKFDALGADRWMLNKATLRQVVEVGQASHREELCPLGALTRSVPRTGGHWTWFHPPFWRATDPNCVVTDLSIWNRLGYLLDPIGYWLPEFPWKIEIQWII